MLAVARQSTEWAGLGCERRRRGEKPKKGDRARRVAVHLPSPSARAERRDARLGDKAADLVPVVTGEDGRRVPNRFSPPPR